MPSQLPFLIRPSADLLSKHPWLYQHAGQLSRHFQAFGVLEADLTAIGSALWQVLDINATLPSQALMIECHNNAIESLPWECLYHPQLGFLGKHSNYTLSRHIMGNHKKVAPAKGPLKILLLTAQPEKIVNKRARLDIEIEQHWVSSALEPFISAGQVQFYAPNDGRFSTLVQLLHNQSWHVVILSGHGSVQPANISTTKAPYGRMSATDALKSAFFLFESDDGEGEWVAADTLASAFNGTSVQCVIVAACQSAQGLMMPIARTGGVPHVVGMREPLIDRAGTIFVRTFCVALAQRERIDVAVQKGRMAMTQLLASNEVWRDIAPGAGHSETAAVGQWCLPMLLSYDLTQPIVDWHFSPKSRPPSRVGSQIALPELFMGRRQELRTLGEGLGNGKIPRLLIRGAGGLGKTALAGRLATTLVAQKDYRVLAYQAGSEVGFIETLAQVLESDEKNQVPNRERQISPTRLIGDNYLTDSNTPINIRVLFFEALKQLIQGRWILWLDSLEHIQNPLNGSLTDPSIQTALDILCQCKATDLRILLTSRWAIPTVIKLYDYRLTRPNFNEFSRYIEYMGLSYSLAQRLKIYQMLKGNYQGTQLLQTLPLCQGATDLSVQLALVQRYLQAYMRTHQKNLKP